jgi:hypothetical protein
MLRLSGPDRASNWVAQIDMDNPAGSVHPNMLYVSAPPWLPEMEGEALATSLALQVGLPAQLRFLRGVNVTGIDAGMSGIDLAQIANGVDGGPGMAIIEAWLAVLLLRHHRARLLLASRGLPVSSEELTGSRGMAAKATMSAVVATASPVHASTSTGLSTSLPSSLPSCPDLTALMVVLEQPDTLLTLLRRERAAWNDPEWVRLVRGGGRSAAGAAEEQGEEAVRAAQLALGRAAQVEEIDPSDLFLYGAALRGQLKRVLGHSAMMRMLGPPHVSLGDLLHGGAVRMLRVNLSGAYRTAAHPYSEDDLARKHYGLYLLWSLWAVARQREVLNRYRLETVQQCHAGYEVYAKPNPNLIMLHGAGAWFGSGSPLSEASTLQQFGLYGSEMALAATVSGLRHLRAYRASASDAFGNLIIGPAPVADPDAPDVTLSVVDHEVRLLREGMERVADKLAPRRASSTGAEDPQVASACQALDADRLLTVLRRIDDGSALVVAGQPGGRKAVCTAYVGSGAASDVRHIWSRSSDVVVANPSLNLVDEQGPARQPAH